MPGEYSRLLGARLRTVRNQQGLSLHGVEARSGGVWKAVVVGSYERGDRAVSVERLADLAEFYGVPLVELLPGSVRGPMVARPARLVLDLVALAATDDPEAAALIRFVESIQALRGDYNGRVLSLRHEDLRTLCVIYDLPPDALLERLVRWLVTNADGLGVGA